MAEETYIVAFDIQEQGNSDLTGTHSKAELEKQGALAKTSIGGTEYETGGLAAQGITSVGIARLVEVGKAESAAEAIEVVRKFYPEAFAGGCRAVIKPNTNFKLVV